MQLDKQAVDEFISLYKQEYGVILTRLQAVEYGDRLIHLIKAVYAHKLPEIKNVDKVKKEYDN